MINFPMKKMNYSPSNNNIRTNLYDNIRPANDTNMTRYFTRKTPHSLDKLNRAHTGISSSITKQLANKKLISYSSTKNFQNDNSYQPANQTYQNYTIINNVSTLNQSNCFHNNSTNNISTINTGATPAKIKERLIQNLKNNFSQERIRRKKMLNVNVNVNLNQNYSMINNTNNNNNTTQSFYENPNNSSSNVNIFKRNFYNKKDQPLKLYTDANAFNTHSNININTTPTNNNNKNLNSSLNENDVSDCSNKFALSSGGGQNGNCRINNEKFYDLEIKMEKMFKENKTNSKSRKYNITKFIFEEGIKNLGGNTIMQNFFRKILVTYHEVFLAFSTENKNFKEKTENLTNQNLQIDKNYIELSKKLKQKETEIELLKNKVAAMSANANINNQPPMQYDPRTVTFSALEEESRKNSPSPQMNKHQRFVSDVNQKNVNDLEALYFNDKVEMEDTSRSPKPYKIPQLNLNSLDQKVQQLRNNKTINIKVNNLLKKLQA